MNIRLKNYIAISKKNNNCSYIMQENISAHKVNQEFLIAAKILYKTILSEIVW